MLRQVLPAILGGLLLVGALQACAISSAEQDAIRRAWEERDAERARECQRAGRGFVAGVPVAESSFTAPPNVVNFGPL